MKIDPHCPQQKRRPMNLVSGGIRLIRIFPKVPGEGASNDSRVVENCKFQQFRWLFFLDTLEMRPALLYGDMQSVIGISVIPKCTNLNDLNWLFRVKFCLCTGLAGWHRSLAGVSQPNYDTNTFPNHKNTNPNPNLIPNRVNTLWKINQKIWYRLGFEPQVTGVVNCNATVKPQR